MIANKSNYCPITWLQEKQRKAATHAQVPAILPTIIANQRSKNGKDQPTSSRQDSSGLDPDRDDQLSSRHSDLRKQLFDAAKSDNVGRMKEALEAVSRVGGRVHAGSDALRDPETSMNVLLCALVNDCTATAEYLLGVLDEATIIQDYKVKVKGIGSNKTALHVLTEGGNLALMRRLLGRLPPGKDKKAYIKKEACLWSGTTHCFIVNFCF